MTLFIDADEYLGHMADSVGALVSLQSPFTQSNQIDGDPIFVAPGSAVSVSVNAVGPIPVILSIGGFHSRDLQSRGTQRTKATTAMLVHITKEVQ